MMTVTQNVNEVVVDFMGDTSIKNIMQTTIKALKCKKGEKVSQAFQREAVSSGRPFMDVVQDYVTIS